MRRAALLGVAVCVLGSGVGAQRVPSINREPFNFEAPGLGQTAAERGWLEVPVRHGRPDGGSIRLRVVRLKSMNPKPGLPVVFLAGGPGNVGTNLVTGPLAPIAARIRAFASDDRWRDPADSDRWLARVAAAMQAGAPAGTRVNFIDQVKRVFAQLDKEPIRAMAGDAEVLIGKADIQILLTIQSGNIGFVQNLPVVFDSLEKRTRLRLSPHCNRQFGSGQSEPR